LTRPSGSGNLEQNSTGHSNPGFALTVAVSLTRDWIDTNDIGMQRTAATHPEHFFRRKFARAVASEYAIVLCHILSIRSPNESTLLGQRRFASSPFL